MSWKIRMKKSAAIKNSISKQFKGSAKSLILRQSFVKGATTDQQ